MRDVENSGFEARFEAHRGPNVQVQINIVAIQAGIFYFCTIASLLRFLTSLRTAPLSAFGGNYPHVRGFNVYLLAAYPISARHKCVDYVFGACRGHGDCNVIKIKNNRRSWRPSWHRECDCRTEKCGCHDSLTISWWQGARNWSMAALYEVPHTLAKL